MLQKMVCNIFHIFFLTKGSKLLQNVTKIVCNIFLRFFLTKRLKL